MNAVVGYYIPTTETTTGFPLYRTEYYCNCSNVVGKVGGSCDRDSTFFSSVKKVVEFLVHVYTQKSYYITTFSLGARPVRETACSRMCSSPVVTYYKLGDVS